MNQIQGIENLIIDLGGVLYAIDPKRVIHAFSLLMGGGSGDLTHVTQHVNHNPLWKIFEKGEIVESEFRNRIREDLGINSKDVEINAAWNSMLIGPFEGRSQLLGQLSGRYRLILLSNTNSIHFRYLSPHSKSILAPFEKLFLSYQMGQRKPDQEIFEKVLAWGNFDPSKTLFIDDSLVNVKGALAVGIQAKHVEENSQLTFTDLCSGLL